MNESSSGQGLPHGPGEETRARILDAAEGLFARVGYHHASLRAITREAGVNLAAVHYHFGSKEALLDRVIERRIVPLNRVRAARLEEVREGARRKGQRPRVEELVRALVEPTMAFRDSGQGARAFIAFLGRAFYETDDTVRRRFFRHVKEFFFVLFRAFAEALPEVAPEVLLWRLQFAFGALGHLLTQGPAPRLVPPGVRLSGDTAGAAEELIAFMSAGIRGGGGR